MEHAKFAKWAFLVLLAVLAAIQAGCYDSFHGGIEEVVSRTFTVSPGGILAMDLNLGAIEVTAREGTEVSVTAVRLARTSDPDMAKKIFAEYPVDFSQSGADVAVRGRGPRHRGLSFLFHRSRCRIRYNVTIPPRYNLDLRTSGGSIDVGDMAGRLQARTSGGRLKLGNIKGPVDGRTSGGSIDLESSSADVDLETSGGRVRVGVAAGAVRIDTSGGSIRIEEARGTVNASTSGGSVFAALSQQPGGDCRLTTSGGSITLYLADGIRADLDAHTSGGGVHTDIPAAVQGEIGHSRLEGKINGGGPRILLRTSGGGVYIRRLEQNPDR